MCKIVHFHGFQLPKLRVHPAPEVHDFAIKGMNFLSHFEHLRLDREGGEQLFLSCACFLITQQFLNVYRHVIHQIKAEYHSYRLVLIILYNSTIVKLKIVKEIEN